MAKIELTINTSLRKQISHEGKDDETLDAASNAAHIALSNAGFDISSIVAEEAGALIVTFGIGEQYSPNEFEMWLGPVRMERECISTPGRSDMSRILKYDTDDGVPKITHRWSEVMREWIEDGKSL